MSSTAVAEPTSTLAGRSGSTATDRPRLERLDYIVVATFCLALFGYSVISGRPLSLHEARLPETSREMMASGDWLIPRSGGRPWLERPPLPHWVEVSVSAVLGQHCDSVWVVRLPAALMGCTVVLLAAWIGTALRGRAFGLVTALVLATMYEFYAYSSLAEDDIFLAAVVAIAMALFVRIEFVRPRADELTGWGRTARGTWTFLGRRRLSVLAFFLVVGLSGLAKGPLVGAMVIAPTVATFLFVSGGVRRMRQFIWAWGWLAFLAVALAWPVLVYRRYPEAWENWRFDYAGGTDQYDQPIWYYPVVLLMAMLPWTPAALLGLWLLVRKAIGGTDRAAVHAHGAAAAGNVATGTTHQAIRATSGGALTRAEQLILCWSIIPIAILSLPHRKHHHYLVPNLAPWAMVAAYGLFDFAPALFRSPAWQRRPRFGLLVAGLPGAVVILLLHRHIPGPPWIAPLLAAAWVMCIAIWYVGLHRQRAALTFAAVLFGTSVAYCWGQSCLPDQTTDDTAFLRRVDATVPSTVPLLINSDYGGEMDFFRISFYLRPTARLIHNLSFLRDEKLAATPTVYLITRAHDRPILERLGRVEEVDQSAHTRRETSPQDRFTLFRLTFRPDLPRYPAPAPDQISTMQAMGRKQGPYCGPDWPPPTVIPH